MTGSSSTEPAAVGVIGLGIMGGAMARSFVSAGWRATGFDIDPARHTASVVAGVLPADSPDSLIETTDVILTSLPAPEAVCSAATRIALAKDRKILIETSTLSLADKLAIQQAMYAAGHIALDCPLSGTGAQARKKDLIVYAGGDSAAIRSINRLYSLLRPPGVLPWTVRERDPPQTDRQPHGCYSQRSCRGSDDAG